LESIQYSLLPASPEIVSDRIGFPNDPVNNEQQPLNETQLDTPTYRGKQRKRKPKKQIDNWMINNLDGGDSSDQAEFLTSTPFKQPTQSQLALATGGPVGDFVRGRVDHYISSIDQPLDAYTPSEEEVAPGNQSDREIIEELIVASSIENGIAILSMIAEVTEPIDTPREIVVVQNIDQHLAIWDFIPNSFDEDEENQDDSETREHMDTASLNPSNSDLRENVAETHEGGVQIPPIIIAHERNSDHSIQREHEEATMSSDGTPSEIQMIIDGGRSSYDQEDTTREFSGEYVVAKMTIERKYLVEYCKGTILDTTDSIMIDLPIVLETLTGIRLEINQQFGLTRDRFWKERKKLSEVGVVSLTEENRHLFAIFNRLRWYDDPDPDSYMLAIQKVGLEAMERHVTILATVKCPSVGRYRTWRQNANWVGEILKWYGVRLRVFTQEY
jgi:hypothetical protein